MRGRGTRVPAASARSTAIANVISSTFATTRTTRTTTTTTTTTAAPEVVEVRPTRRTIKRRPTRIQGSQQQQQNKLDKEESYPPRRESVQQTENIPPRRESVVQQSERRNPIFNQRRQTTPRTTTEAPTTTEKITTLRTTQRPTTTKTTTTTTTTTSTPPTTLHPTLYQIASSEEVNDELASVLPAITSARPRQQQHPKNQPKAANHQYNNQFTFDSSSEGFVPFIPNYIESTAQPLVREQQQPPQSQQPTYEQYLKQQFKIKGLDIESTEEAMYNEDEKLIGVLGSQVR